MYHFNKWNYRSAGLLWSFNKTLRERRRTLVAFPCKTIYIYIYIYINKGFGVTDAVHTPHLHEDTFLKAYLMILVASRMTTSQFPPICSVSGKLGVMDPSTP